MDDDPKKTALKAAGIVAIIIGALVALQVLPGVNRDSQEDAGVVDSFEECAAAGNPVMESYPPQCTTKDGVHFTQDIGNELEKLDIIQIDNPRPGQIITSPLIVRGNARGFWFFEASFPIELVDDTGKRIASYFAEAQDEWMTEQTVPYRGELLFEAPDSDRGTLILRKANASGLPEHDDTLLVPVRFR